MKENINTKKIIKNMEQKNIKVVSIDTDNMLYMCDDGNEYPLTENEIKMFKLVIDVVKSHEEFMDSLPSVKPISISNKKIL